MDSFLLIFTIITILCSSYSEDVNIEERRGMTPVTPWHIKNKTDEVNSGLPPKKLSELYDLSKSISHSKGAYRETTESGDEKEVRRSILKKAAVVSESDALRAILQAFESDENKLDLLEHMEFLVHQYDVAVNFAVSGGLKIITPYLFSDDDKIVIAVASVLGAAMQSNPKVQKLAISQDVGKSLLQLLTHKSPQVLSRVIFALSSLLRNVPKAQEEFIAVDGFSKFAELLQNPQIVTNTKLRIINLFNDLAVEQETVEDYPHDRSSEEIESLKRRFAGEMQKNGVCKLIPSFLNLEDFDTHQKIITAMISLHGICHNYFKSNVINKRLKKLLKIYDPDVDNNDPLYPFIDKDLRQALHAELKDLIKKTAKKAVNKTFNSSSKTEL